MKIGLVSDIHCNLYGLTKAIEVMGDIDELFCLGDVISHTRFSNNVVGLLRDRGARMVIGNHDVDFLTRLGDKAVAEGVADASLVAWLRGAPEVIDIEVSGGKRLIAIHSTPWTRDYVQPGSREMKKFAQVEADFVLGGHTHQPFAGRIGRALVVNPGSAGEAVYRPPAAPVLSCAVLDTDTDEAVLIDYPPEA